MKVNGGDRIKKWLEYKNIPVTVNYNSAGRGFYRVMYKEKPLPITSFEKEKDAWLWIDKYSDLIEYLAED